MSEKKVTIKDLQKEIVVLERLTSALNTTCLALAYANGIKGDELDKVKAEDFADYVTEHLHPLIRRADELVVERAKQVMEELSKEEENKDEDSRKDNENGDK